MGSSRGRCRSPAASCRDSPGPRASLAARDAATAPTVLGAGLDRRSCAGFLGEPTPADPRGEAHTPRAFQYDHAKMQSVDSAKIAAAGQELVRWILDQARDGIGPLSSASDLAEEYKRQSYGSDVERVQALIRSAVAKNAATGFVTGLGGVLMLPVAIPSSLAASLAIQARMIAAIAEIYRHDSKDDRVQTAILLCMVGTAMEDVVKQAGVTLGGKAAIEGLKMVPGRVLVEINKRVGFRLLTKFGEKGVMNLAKLVPLVGGAVGGALDGATCYMVGQAADRAFRSDVEFRDPLPGASSRPSGAVGRGRVLEALLWRHGPCFEESRRVARLKCRCRRSLVVLCGLHCESRSQFVQSVPKQALLGTRSGNRSYVPRVHLPREVPDGGHADHAMGKRERRRAQLLRGWRSGPRVCATVATRHGSPGRPLDVRRVVDRVVPVHRSDTHRAYGANVARQRCGDGSL